MMKGMEGVRGRGCYFFSMAMAMATLTMTVTATMTAMIDYCSLHESNGMIAAIRYFSFYIQ
jgi:hypothetical protein